MEALLKSDELEEETEGGVPIEVLALQIGHSREQYRRKINMTVILTRFCVLMVFIPGAEKLDNPAGILDTKQPMPNIHTVLW